ncbi:MAG: helix-turn-helix transcriptional regulator [Acidobacteria bacterium]|nr:helix-turn-helix transcriptional regulator [Acidobacteriota bacterium]
MDNRIVGGVASRYEVRDYAGPLSLKTVVNGGASWETASARFDLAPGAALVLNDGEEYSIVIDALQPVETFCIFFARGFVEDAFRAAITSSAHLLDAPAPPPVGFFARTHRTPNLLRALDAMRCGGGSMIAIANALVRCEVDVDAAAARLPALKLATRTELAARLRRGAAFIHASLDRPLTVEDLAKEACLSTFHFHRLFTAFFGETPHRHIDRLRLERAKALLRGSRRSITEIAGECGFETPGAFATRFAKRFGVPPRAFRKNGEVRAAPHA